MKDYRTLSDWEKAKVDKAIVEEIEPKHNINKHNGFNGMNQNIRETKYITETIVLSAG